MKTSPPTDHADHGDHEYSHEGHNHSHEGHNHSHDGQEPTASSGTILLNTAAKGDQKTTLAIAGMDCADEVAAVERALQPLKGVREVRVALMAGKAVIAHDSSVSPQQLIDAIAVANLKATLPGTAAAADAAASTQRMRLITVGLSGLLTTLGLAVGWAGIGPA